MWFVFPKGVDQISVEQQNFRSEIEDEEGRKFFRAPDHFAPVILDLPGFSRGEPPEGAPPDLPKQESPQRTDIIDQLSAQVDSLRVENERHKREIEALTAERDALMIELNEVKSQIKEMEEEEKEGTEDNKSKPTLESSKRK